MGEQETRAISEVLEGLEAAGGEETVSVRDIVAQMGDRSFAPLLLVPALLMVSPVSAIPGTPTISAVVIALIVVQMLVGRDSLWLPAFVTERKVAAARMERAVAFLRSPVRWIEPKLRPRLTALTDRPGSYVALLTCLSITLVMPLMELVPALASITALAISLFAAGLMTRDGSLVLLGYTVVGLGAMLARSFV